IAGGRHYFAQQFRCYLTQHQTGERYGPQRLARITFRIGLMEAPEKARIECPYRILCAQHRVNLLRADDFIDVLRPWLLGETGKHHEIERMATEKFHGRPSSSIVKTVRIVAASQEFHGRPRLQIAQYAMTGEPGREFISVHGRLHPAGCDRPYRLK